MSVLIGKKLRKAIKRGHIRVTPFSPDLVGSASIDLRLGKVFFIFKRRHKPVTLTKKTGFRRFTRKVTVGPAGLLLQSGETVLALTEERIALSLRLAGRLEGRSCFARLGLTVHITAGFMHPGIKNRQMLEMTNLGPTPLILVSGTPVCQMIFERCKGKARYHGRYATQ